jgi:redox-sensitive bicupin YhaK (pirin superfamily)
LKRKKFNQNKNNMINKRKATQIVRGQHAVDGAGVRLRRVLGTNNITDFDPFLMLDGFDSTDPDDYIKGFPWHPSQRCGCRGPA